MSIENQICAQAYDPDVPGGAPINELWPGVPQGEMDLAVNCGVIHQFAEC